ncbi:MAG: single-stranded DNA-binding protein, partial [Steroidobacteraceae bacterium]
GNDRYTTEIVASEMQMLGGRGGSGGGGGAAQETRDSRESSGKGFSQAPQSERTGGAPSADFDDDIPF